jgi:hypothetical protein
VELQLLRQRHAVLASMPSNTRACGSDSDSDSDRDRDRDVDHGGESSPGAAVGEREGRSGGGGPASPPGSSCFGATSSLPASVKEVEARLHGCRSLLAVCVGTINDALEELRYEAAELEVEEEGLD